MNKYTYETIIAYELYCYVQGGSNQKANDVMLHLTCEDLIYTVYTYVPFAYRIKVKSG